MASASYESALRAAPNIARLRERAHAAKVPVIYVNDTAGKWESDPKAFVDRCMQPDSPGRKIVQLLAPTPEDYFMFKPRHSGVLRHAASYLAPAAERFTNWLLPASPAISAYCSPPWMRTFVNMN